MGRHTELTGQGVPAVRLPQPYTYHGKHRADERCACGRMDCQGHGRPPSPTYSFTLVEQPGGGA